MIRTLALLSALPFLLCGALLAAKGEGAQFDPDTDADRLDWSMVETVLGPAPDVRGERFGAVVKTQTNEYWRLMTAGYRKQAAADEVKLDIQSAHSESNPALQLAVMETMIGGRYRGILISPQSDRNLQAAIEDAEAATIPLLNVDGAVVNAVKHFVGPVNGRMGERVADWFVKRFPAGGKLAIIEGQAGVFSTVKRTAGFRRIIEASGRFEIVGSVPGDWDRRKSFTAATVLMLGHPDLLGIYCNNDTMALGVVEAADALHLLDRIKVFGNDGTSEAYASIKEGRLAGTVDIFPAMVGSIGLGLLERLAAGRPIPRVIVTPQALVTRDNVARYYKQGEELRRRLVEDGKTER